MSNTDGARVFVLNEINPQDLSCVPKVRHDELVHECLTESGRGIVAGLGNEQIVHVQREH